MKTLNKMIAGGAVLLVLAGACTPKEPVMEPGTFTIDNEYLSATVPQERTVCFIPVQTNIPETEWTFSSSDESWCQASWSISNEKGVMVSVDANEEPDVREATVTVRARTAEYRIAIQQFGYGPSILVSDVAIGPEGGQVVMQVTANVEYTVNGPQMEAEDGEWLTFVSDAPTRAFAGHVYVYQAEPNILPYNRKARLTVAPKDSRFSDAAQVCTVTQTTVPASPEDLFSDEKIQPLSAIANQAHAGDGPENLIDGVYGSGYHSPWALGYDNPTTQFPVVLEFEFDGTRRIDYMYIMHSNAYNDGTVTAGSANGRIGQFNVYYKTAADADYIFEGAYDFGQAGGYQQAVFGSGIVNPVWVKLEVLDGSGDNGESGGFVAAAEVEFYNSNKDDLNAAIDKVFTDRSCTALKDGITRKDIIAMSAVAPYIAINVAIPLLEGTYTGLDYEFRAHAYEPYSNPADYARKLVTNIYTSMDNPTGIEVSAGEELIVCVDQVPAGQEVALTIYGDNGEEPNYGGMGMTESVNQRYVLSPGLNSVKITANGMAYVHDWAANLSASSKSVKVHILPGGGTVQGYFGLKEHKTDERYKELLARNTWKYFLVKGEKAELLLHTSVFRSYAPSAIVDVLKLWDDIVRWEHEMSGIDRHTGFNNHMMAVSTTEDGAYMDASNRRIHVAKTAYENLLTVDKLSDNEWGVAHEYGHLNQKAINWRSTTESSNNLFSNYVRYKIGRTISRGESIRLLAESWAGGKSWLLLGNNSQYQGEDAELHMRMNWQLWNYYHRCGYKTDFFPTLFGILREDPLPNEYDPVWFGVAEDNGACQLKYYEKACEAAGEDLTEFFETWGFFRPVDQQFDQYGTVQYRVTQQMIDAARQRVAAKNYPKAAAIQYIEDRKTEVGATYSQMGFYDVFKNKTTVSKTPKASVSGRNVKVSDCDQAVAVEVRKSTTGDALGDLLYFSNLYDFTSPVDLAGTTLYAVQYDGKRIKINQ